jgi:hypothetical protein
MIEIRLDLAKESQKKGASYVRITTAVWCFCVTCLRGLKLPLIQSDCHRVATHLHKHSKPVVCKKPKTFFTVPLLIQIDFFV